MLALMLCLTACTHTIKVEPIEVKPITLNINIKIDRELDEFFDYQEPAGATSPATATDPQQQGDAR